MLSCPIPRKVCIPKKPLSPLLPESIYVIKPRATGMSKEKLEKRLARLHRKTKLDLDSCRQSLEIKKLKAILEARKGKTAKNPIVVFDKPKHTKIIKKESKKEIRYSPEPKKALQVNKNLKMNPNYYWSARDAHAGLIILSHLFGKIKKEFEHDV